MIKSTTMIRSRYMDFSWTEEQEKFKAAVIEFAKAELNDGVLERDRTSEFSRESWEACARFGILGLPLAKEYGGMAADIITTMYVMEGLGYGCRDHGLVFMLNAQMWSVQHPLTKFGTEEQKVRFLPKLCRGEIIGAHAMSEPDSGSDAFSLKTRAVRTEDGYVLNGTKMFVTGAPVCDLAVVFATEDPELGKFGITAFLVERGIPGFKVSKDIEKMGLRTAPMGEVILEDCFVPESHRLGPRRGGAAVFNSSMEWERSCILASQVGAMERQLEEVIQYAQTRKQFNQPIGKFQSVANRVAAMKVRLETSRLLLYKVAWLKKMGKHAAMEAALAKLYLSESFLQSSLDALKTYGGYGYTTEFEVERDLRDAVGGTLYSGTSDIQRVIIARLLGL